LSAYFDRALTPPLASSIETHVNSCTLCQRSIEQFATLRNLLQATTPAASTRSFRLTGDHASSGFDRSDRRSSRSPAFPLYPVFAAIAAVLLLALIAGDFFLNDDNGNSPSEHAADQVLYIDGTPYYPSDDDAEFGAASAEDMNGAESDRAAVEADEESGVGSLSGWRIAQIATIAALASTLALWYLQRRTNRASIS
jgi:anti-sigma-K factor RskA